jgi:DNA-directed RNA polymerase specialized sigma24 family protein
MNEMDQLAQRVTQRAAALALYARQWLGEESSAEDVVQEALTALLMERHVPPDPIAWMYRAVQTAEQALRELPAEFREVVVLRIWGELGLAQIAEITQTSVSTVHKRYNDAIDRLRNLLEKPCPTNLTK